MPLAIGYWIRNLGDEEFIAAQEIKGEIAKEHRMELVRYLNSGVTFEQYRGYSWCRFWCGIDDSKMGSSCLTDGTWVWPQGLSHYLTDHEIILPDEFVIHVLKGSSPRQCRTDEEIDFSFWISWCSKRRSPKLLERIRAAREIADSKAAEAHRRRIASEIQKHGVSENPCIVSGCNERALLNKRICAEHSLSQWDRNLFYAEYYGPLFRNALII